MTTTNGASRLFVRRRTMLFHRMQMPTRLCLRKPRHKAGARGTIETGATETDAIEEARAMIAARARVIGVMIAAMTEAGDPANRVASTMMMSGESHLSQCRLRLGKRVQMQWMTAHATKRLSTRTGRVLHARIVKTQKASREIKAKMVKKARVVVAVVVAVAAAVAVETNKTSLGSRKVNQVSKRKMVLARGLMIGRRSHKIAAMGASEASVQTDQIIAATGVMATEMPVASAISAMFARCAMTATSGASRRPKQERPRDQTIETHHATRPKPASLAAMRRLW